MLFFLLRALRNSSGILLGSRARLDRIFAHKLVHRKGRSPKSYLALFKIADKISMSQRALQKVSQRYIPLNETFKNDRNGLHFMTGASLRLGPGNNSEDARFLHEFTDTITIAQ